MADAETLRLLALQSLHRSKADADEPEEGEVRARALGPTRPEDLDDAPRWPRRSGALFAERTC